MGKFDGRVAIITGGGKGGGIGYGLSTAFAKEGCNLVITGGNTKKLDDAKEELEELDKAAPAGAAEQPKKKKSFLGRLFGK